MNPRLAELVERARDSAISAADDAELASLLVEPAERAEAAAQWRDGLLLAALATRPAGEVSALVRSVASSRPSQVHRQVRVRYARQWWRGMGGSLLAAGLLAAIGLVAFVVLPAHRVGSAVIAILGDDDAGVRVVRNGVAGSAHAGMALLAEDQLLVDGGTASLAVVRYPDRSRMELLAGTTVRLWDEAGAKRVRLDQGKVRCEVTKQPAGMAMKLLTDQAEAEVVGTRFSLRVAAGDTRLEVAEGLVSLKKCGEAATVMVAAGHMAVAVAGVPLAAVRIPPPTPVPEIGTTLAHGQEIKPGVVGRAGAASLRLANFASELETLAGAQVISSSRTLRNQRFTGKVLVTGGEVTFEFCSFEYIPEAIADAQLQQYNRGRNAGRIVCNWCDFDPGLRGAQGLRETFNVQLGELGMANPPTVGSRSTLYRCRLQGCGNGVGIHRYRSAGSDISECLIGSLTHGDRNHSEGVEIRSSDNITIERSRIVVDPATDQSCLIITPSLGKVVSARPILIQDCYLAGGAIPVIITRYGDGPQAEAGDGSDNVRFIANRFGDASNWGRLCNFNRMDVTHDLAYAAAHPRVIYWASSNVWAPDGEGVTSPATAPSGDAPAGLPHTSGGFVDARNFFGGETWIWDGKVLP